MTYRHGSPYDRGAADAFYGRPYDPHYYLGDSYHSDRVEAKDMTPEELNDYDVGYYSESDRKEY